MNTPMQVKAKLSITSRAMAMLYRECARRKIPLRNDFDGTKRALKLLLEDLEKWCRRNAHIAFFKMSFEKNEAGIEVGSLVRCENDIAGIVLKLASAWCAVSEMPIDKRIEIACTVSASVPAEERHDSQTSRVLHTALCALGSFPEGYCFCGAGVGANGPHRRHTGECLDAQRAIAMVERREKQQEEEDDD